MNRLQIVRSFGQRIWLDNLSRELLARGELARLVTEDGVAGVTSNPTILYHAIHTDPQYHHSLTAFKAQGIKGERAYEELVIPDITAACNLLLPTYQESNRQDGYVSLEVSPFLAHDTAGTLDAARRLWQRVACPNLMVKIPATSEGIEAFRVLIRDGMNVNITLLFSLKQLNAVWDAYVDGLNQRLQEGKSLAHVKAVASMFLSRIDSVLDPMLPCQLQGKVAIALAKTAYQQYLQRFHGQAFQRFTAAGAYPQYLLWASTATKNPAYSDVLYVERLIGAETINTMPNSTLEKFRDHGHAANTLTENLELCSGLLEHAEASGVNLTIIGDRLQHEGLALFSQSFTELLALMA